jgi:hypothetical protein
VTGRADARRLVHVHADVALLRQQRLAGVKPYPNANGFRLKRLLGLSRSGERLARLGEGIEEGVALRVDLHAAVRSERTPQQPAVLRERLRVTRCAEVVQQARRALDVREDEGDRA